MLLLADDTVHGYKIHQQLHARGLAIQPATMYRRLRRFEQEGWVRSSWSVPIGGPRRHLYVLTPQGRAALHEMSASIAATRDAYGAFADAHGRARAQRSGATGGAGQAPPRGHGERDPELSIAGADTDRRDSPTRLRPHAELLAGWLLLHLEVGAAHGYDLRRDIDDVHRLTTDSGTVYRMLRRFEANKWVRSHWSQSVGGPPRRIYRLTATGRLNLDDLAQMITAIGDGLDAYLLAYEQRRDGGAPTPIQPDAG